MKVVLSGRARADLLRQLDWLETLNATAAKRAEATIAASLRALSEQPRGGREVSDDGLREWPIRFGAYGYVVHYRVLRDRVHVSRIFHGAQDRGGGR